MLALAGCSKSPGPAATTPAERIELEIPAPAANTRGSVRETIARSSIPAGVFALSLSTTSRHGCSRSWMTSSMTTRAKLEIGDGIAMLDVKEDVSTLSGSHGTRSEPMRSHHSSTTQLRGTFTEVGPGKLQASLVPASCKEGCAERAIELLCEVQRIPLDARDSGTGAVELGEGAGETIEGLFCYGLEKVVDARGSENGLPLGAGAGVEVDRTSFGYGSATSKTYRAVAAVTP